MSETAFVLTADPRWYDPHRRGKGMSGFTDDDLSQLGRSITGDDDSKPWYDRIGVYKMIALLTRLYLAEEIAGRISNEHDSDCPDCWMCEPLKLWKISKGGAGE